LDNDLGAQESEGTNEGDAQGFTNCSVRTVELGVQGFVAGFFDEILLFAVEEDGWVGFLEEEKTAYLNQAVSNGGGVKYPSPSGIFCDKSSRNGTNSGSKKWG
jgi:hypothetical protein